MNTRYLSLCCSRCACPTQHVEQGFNWLPHAVASFFFFPWLLGWLIAWARHPTPTAFCCRCHRPHSDIEGMVQYVVPESSAA